MTVPHQNFAFDTVFDNAGGMTAPVRLNKRVYTAEEVELIRQAAFAEGQAAALALAEAQQAQALMRIADAAQAALPRLAEVAHAHRAGSAELALACGRAIADAALERFPQAPIKAALDALASEIQTAPRLVVNTSAELAGDLQALIELTAQANEFAGQVVVRTDPGLAAGAFALDFGDGAARFDPAAAAARVSAALDAALASEGLHAEPLIPAPES